MKARRKDYYLEGRGGTAKKGRQLLHQNHSQTPISQSVSYNHHKYEQQIPQDEPLRTKLVLRSNQMKSYCNSEEDSSQELAKRHHITSKIFQSIHNNYQLLGDHKEVWQNKMFLAQVTPLPSRRCEYCQQLGGSCREYQANRIEKSLEDDVGELECKWDQHVQKGEQLLSMIQSREQYKNASSEYNNLRKIESMQERILCSLEQSRQG